MKVELIITLTLCFVHCIGIVQTKSYISSVKSNIMNVISTGSENTSKPQYVQFSWLGGSVNKPTIALITWSSHLFFFRVLFLFFSPSFAFCPLVHFLSFHRSSSEKWCVYPVVWVCLVETCSWQRLTHSAHSFRCVPADCLDRFFI